MTKIYSRVKTNLTNNRGQSKGALVFGIAISAVILLIIGVVLAWMFLSSGEISIEKAVNAYYEALSNNNVDEYVSTCYTNKWADNYKENGQSVDIKDAVEKVFSYQSGATFGEAHISLVIFLLFLPLSLQRLFHLSRSQKARALKRRKLSKSFSSILFPPFFQWFFLFSIPLNGI